MELEVVGTSEQVTQLFKALIVAQGSFPPIPKKKRAYNYKYAPLSDIHEMTRQHLAQNGLAVFHPLLNKNGLQMVGTTLVHTAGGRISCDGLVIPAGLKIQEQGAYVTYISRYGYCAMLGLTSEDEDEKRLAQKPESTKPKSATPAPAKSAPKDDSDSAPTKQERIGYVAKLTQYRKQVTDDALQAFLLRESGASEVRLMSKEDWLLCLAKLDNALAEGRLLEVVSATQRS